MIKLHVINLMFGKVNHVDYATSMMHFPTVGQLADMIEKDE